MDLDFIGIRIGAFRGIGDDAQTIAPLSRFNIFIGANNSGKSTVLDFLHSFGSNEGLEKLIKQQLRDADRHRGGSGQDPYVQVAIARERFYQNIQSIMDSAGTPAREALDTLMDTLSEGDLVWLKPADTRYLTWTFAYPYEANIGGLGNDSLWYALRPIHPYNDRPSQRIEFLKRLLNTQTVTFPTVKFVPAMRRIGTEGMGGVVGLPSYEMSDYSGRQLIAKLAELQAPDHRVYDADIAKFNKINRFLRTVTGEADARIDVPHNRTQLNVFMNGKMLPLSSLGTGIEQVVMLAAFCTISQDEVLCIEEPELHLHPVLQRKLITYLSDETTNIYFIATHSAVFMDIPDASIFRVSNDGKSTAIAAAIKANDKHDICHALGYRASDILQSNSIIWVEGPSDREYLNHWIRSKDPSLKEGLHYSIMFYGGKLLSHLSAGDEDLEEFIHLPRLNRNMAMIIDSDKAHTDAAIRDTKQRIQDELVDGLCWITAGREIENYIQHSTLQAAVAQTHPAQYSAPGPDGPFEKALAFVRKDTDALDPHFNVNKMKVARLVTETPADFSMLDLDKQILALIAMIRKANHLDESRTGHTSEH